MADIHLGLIGDNIAASQAPRLHQLAGAQFGAHVQYDLLVPLAQGTTAQALFERARAQGFQGLNITYPYKETATQWVDIPEPLVRAIGAVNTVVFTADGAKGYNTDHSGFVASLRRAKVDVASGVVTLIGAGGVGKAVAFGLIALGVAEIRIVDLNAARADGLAMALRDAARSVAVHVVSDVVAAAKGADGLINCTPIGMVGHAGTPMPADAMRGARWAFDAVYTPRDTAFLDHARRAGLQVVSGYELFVFQGVHAWSKFDGRTLDEDQLRADLEGPP